ncbi:MAG: hypothetical protein LBG06_09700 [Deltaproteobacteria bacterium]|jgi:hypothetical protein|nr:hypothetical protein [Deltaproteobacteria bacterium]
MGHLLAALASAGGYAGFFLAFSLSLDFWGRLLLRALRAGDAAEPDGLLPCLAAASAVFVLCRWLSFFTHSLEAPFTVFFALGGVGAALDLARRARTAAGEAGGGGIKALAAVIRGYEWAAVAGALAFALGFWFAWIWPSGVIEPWLPPAGDYFAWMYHAAYWMGYGDADTIGIEYLHPWNFDGFGTQILFAMYASARGLPAYLAAPGFAILLLAWCGAGVYLLSHRLAGLPRALAWLASLGVAGGALFRFLACYGSTAQLAATVAYLAALPAALGDPAAAPSRRAGFLRLFFPLLFIFSCYQAGYLLFAAIAAGASWLASRFREASPQARLSRGIGNGGRDGGALLGIRDAAWPVLAATLLAAAASPQLAWQVIARTLSAAFQQEGFGVGLLDPALFTGLPLAGGTPFGLWADVRPSAWAVFLAALGGLGAIALGRRGSGFPGADGAALKAAACLFAAFLAAYLAAFALNGDVYQYWKFASMTALPVSFLPATLLVLALRESCRRRPCLFPPAFSLAAACLAAHLLLRWGPQGPRHSADGMESLLPLAATVEHVLAADEGIPLKVFDFLSGDRNYAAATVFLYVGGGRARFVNGLYSSRSRPDYLQAAEAGAPIYSDREYPGLFKGDGGIAPHPFAVYRHTMDDLRRTGAVAFLDVASYTRSPRRRISRIKILPPGDLAGRDLTVRITFAEGLAGLDPSCRGVTAREASDPPERDIGRESGEFMIRAPAEWQKSGYITLLLTFHDLSPFPRRDGMSWDPRDPPVCRYWIDAVDVVPAGEGLPDVVSGTVGRDGGGRPAESGSRNG